MLMVGNIMDSLVEIKSMVRESIYILMVGYIVENL